MVVPPPQPPSESVSLSGAPQGPPGVPPPHRESPRIPSSSHTTWEEQRAHLRGLACAPRGVCQRGAVSAPHTYSAHTATQRQIEHQITMSPHLALLMLSALSASPAAAFYLPGLAPVTYCEKPDKDGKCQVRERLGLCMPDTLLIVFLRIPDPDQPVRESPQLGGVRHPLRI